MKQRALQYIHYVCIELHTVGVLQGHGYVQTKTFAEILFYVTCNHV